MLHVLSVYIVTGENDFLELEGFFPLGCSQKRQEFKHTFHGSIDHSRSGRFKHGISQSRLNGRWAPVLRTEHNWFVCEVVKIDFFIMLVVIICAV